MFKDFDCYTEKKYEVANSIVNFGVDIYNSAKIINEFDHFKILVAKLKVFPPDYKLDLTASLEAAHFILPSLIDAIKIIILFENYFKAKLLVKDFIIHIIKKEEYPDLFKKQKKEPVSKYALIQMANFKHVNNEVIHKGLLKNTLQFSTLVNKKSYTQYYDVSEDILEILKKYNGTRNELHFYHSPVFEISDRTIKEIEVLKTFVESNIIKGIKDNLR